jgi:hypothetical protein
MHQAFLPQRQAGARLNNRVSLLHFSQHLSHLAALLINPRWKGVLFLRPVPAHLRVLHHPWILQPNQVTFRRYRPPSFQQQVCLRGRHCFEVRFLHPVLAKLRASSHQCILQQPQAKFQVIGRVFPPPFPQPQVLRNVRPGFRPSKEVSFLPPVLVKRQQWLHPSSHRGLQVPFRPNFLQCNQVDFQLFPLPTGLPGNRRCKGVPFHLLVLVKYQQWLHLVFLPPDQAAVQATCRVFSRRKVLPTNRHCKGVPFLLVVLAVCQKWLHPKILPQHQVTCRQFRLPKVHPANPQCRGVSFLLLFLVIRQRCVHLGLLPQHQVKSQVMNRVIHRLLTNQQFKEVPSLHRVLVIHQQCWHQLFLQRQHQV